VIGADFGTRGTDRDRDVAVLAGGQGPVVEGRSGAREQSEVGGPGLGDPVDADRAGAGSGARSDRDEPAVDRLAGQTRLVDGGVVVGQGRCPAGRDL
jgi:hypothetical protein